jgi:anti-anti-sigma factor
MGALNEDTDASSGLTVVQSVDGAGRPVLAVTGEIDMATVTELQAVTDGIVADGATAVVFDLSGLRFMDSSGIAFLLTLARRVGRIEVANPSAIIRRVIELSGLTTTLNVTP